MVQEGFIDYYELGVGCCLQCEYAHPGCLCYSCKCSECYWYEPELSGYGPCLKAQWLKEYQRQQYIKRLKEQQEKDNKKFLEKTEKYNVMGLMSRRVVEKVKNPVQIFICQQCGIEFPIYGDSDFLFIENISPICEYCLKENGERKT